MKTKPGEDYKVSTITADVAGFPAAVLIRWPSPMKWREVLKAIKSVAADIAGKRVTWRDLFVYENPWSTYEIQEKRWKICSENQQYVMYEIDNAGRFRSVGKEGRP